MIKTTTIGEGKITLSNEVAKAMGTVKYVPHRDVLEAFNRCKFQSVKDFNGWMLRFRDAHKGMSRSFLAREMVKQNSAQQLC